MGLLDRVSARAARSGVGRKSWAQPPFWAGPDVAGWYGAGLPSNLERIENDFRGYIAGAFKGDGIVFSAVHRRQQVFSQARFLWQRFRLGRPADMFATADLALLERPWPGGTTGELLAHMEQDASLAGNFFATRADDMGRVGAAASGPGLRVVRLRPDWVTIVVSSRSGSVLAADAKVVAFEYAPPASAGEPAPDPLLLLPDEVCHYSPIPDPDMRFRGMSWITPVVREIQADKAATDHKLKFFENGAVHSMALKYPEGTSPDRLRAYKAIYDAEYRGTDNAYKTFHLAGADPIPLSANFQQLDFKVTQGAGETRISAASGVPAVILGISEGLQGSSLNAGNFGAARRLFVDTTVRDLWSKAAPSLATLVPAPGTDVRLWVDDRDVPFLREDAKDVADVRTTDAATITSLIREGFEPDAAIEFVRSGDLSSLVGRHTGLVSVQLQEPGTASPPSGQSAEPTPMPTLGAA